MARSVYVMVLTLACAAPAARADDTFLGGKRPHFLSLAEARVMALGQGAVGQPSLLFPGIQLDGLVSTGGVSLRVFADPNAAPCGYLATYTKHSKSPTARAEVERVANQQVLNVETAYWNLYGSYGNLHSREQALRFAFETFRMVKASFDAGSKSSADLAQCRGQYELFRTQRLQALDMVLDNERQLRQLMGLPLEDGTRLVPCDAPTLGAYRLDWKSSLRETLTRRPELAIARQEVKANRHRLVVAKESRQPDSSTPDNAIRPAVYQSESRTARLQLLRSQVTLQEQELKAERFLGLQYRRLATYHEQIRAQRAQREAYGEQLKARYEDYVAERKSLDILLESQRFYADALANEYAAIASYNNARCCFAYAKGTILDRAHITLADKPPADCPGVRAVTQAHKQGLARVARAKPVPTCSTLAVPKGACSLPALWKSIPPLKDAGDMAAPEEVKTEDLFPAGAATE